MIANHFAIVYVAGCKRKMLLLTMHLLYTPDNEIEVSGDLNVGHLEKVDTSDTVKYASDEVIDI